MPLLPRPRRPTTDEKDRLLAEIDQHGDKQETYNEGLDQYIAYYDSSATGRVRNGDLSMDLKIELLISQGFHMAEMCGI